MNQEKTNKDQQERNEYFEKRLDIANQEMGIVKTDVAWIKEVIKRLDNRVWWILGTIILGFVSLIVDKYLFK